MLLSCCHAIPIGTAGRGVHLTWQRHNHRTIYASIKEQW